MPAPTRTYLRALIVAIIATAATMAIVGSAAARTIPRYTYTGDFYDGFGSTAGTLSFGTDVDLNQVTGNGYVSDPNRLNGSVSQFDPDGDPLEFSALEGATAFALPNGGGYRVTVDNSATASQGNIYALSELVIRGFKSDGTEIQGAFPIGSLRAACGIAVDSEGHLWADDYRSAQIVEFTPSGEPTGRKISYPARTVGFQNGECDLAIDSHDNFYLSQLAIAHGELGYTKKFDSEGNYIEDFGSGFSPAIAVDPGNDHVFMVRPSPFATEEFNSEVVEYDENGEEITSFGAPDPAHSFPGLLSPPSIAINENTHDVYVVNHREYSSVQHVEIFAPTGQALVPTVKTDFPDLFPTKATLKGSVDLDGGGDTTACYFEWGTNPLYGNTIPCSPPSPHSGAGAHPVTAALEGLTQGSSYHYRLVAKNANGIVTFGRDRGFRPQGPAILTGAIVSDVNTDGARISTTIDPNGGETTYRVEYGLDDCDVITCQSLPVGEAELKDDTREDAAGIGPPVLGVQDASVLLDRAPARRDLPLPPGRDERCRRNDGGRRHPQDLRGRLDRRHMRQRADPQSDRRRAAARVPCLRARLGRRSRGV